MTTRFAVKAVVLMAILSLPMGATGCSSLATRPPGEPFGPTRPSSKAIAAKVEPNQLVAVDQSSCVVSKDRWEKAKVGEFHFCAWSK
jgi:hypothetical protein